jgi:2'-5' RNA ligase
MRTFIAIDTSKEVQNHLDEIKKKISIKEAKLKSVESFHLTLKFLGEISNPEKIINELLKIEFSKFQLELSNLGVFPNKKYMKIIWIGLKNNDELFKLYKKIEKSLSKFKFKKDKHKFNPHITIARVKKVYDKKKFIETLDNIKIKILKFQVEKFVLYKSTLTRTGPIYEPIKEFYSS